MNNSIPTIAILVLCFSFFSCSDDSDIEPDLIGDLIENEDVYVRYEASEETVKLIIEDLANTSDDRAAESPIIDFLYIKVDMNNNNLVDTRVDKTYGVSSLGINCMSFIIDATTLTGCIEEEGYSYNTFFRSSTKSSEEHIIYELVLNKENIFSDSETVGLIFSLQGDDSGGNIPSRTSPLFVETLQFSL